MTFYRRLNKEYIKIKDINDPLIKISLYDEDDLRSWRCFLKGPPDSPFENGIFEISINVTNSYPIEPPKCKFMTKIFHPNIDFDSGEICLDILKENWTPSFGIYVCLFSALFTLDQIVYLSIHPNFACQSWLYKSFKHRCRYIFLFSQYFDM